MLEQATLQACSFHPRSLYLESCRCVSNSISFRLPRSCSLILLSKRGNAGWRASERDRGSREGADTACHQNNAHPSPTLPPFIPPFSPQSPRVPPLSSDQVTQTLHISCKKSETLSPKMSGKSRGRRICGWGRKQETPEREMGKKSALP